LGKNGELGGPKRNLWEKRGLKNLSKRCPQLINGSGKLGKFQTNG